MSEDRSSSLSLNEDFQKFLEASLSSDGSEPNLSENKQLQKLWWLEGEDDDNSYQKDVMNRHSWLKKTETKKSDENNKESNSDAFRKESKITVSGTVSEDKEIENILSKEETEFQEISKVELSKEKEVSSPNSKSHISVKDVVISDDQTLAQSLPDDDYAEDTFNTSTFKDEIPAEESNISSHSSTDTLKNENVISNSEKSEINSSIILPKLDEKHDKNEKVEVKNNVDSLSEKENLINEKHKKDNCKRFNNENDKETDLNNKEEKLPNLEISEENINESKKNDIDLHKSIEHSEPKEKRINYISSEKYDDDYDKALNREKDLLHKLSRFQSIYYEEQNKNAKLRSQLINIEKETENKLLEQRLNLEDNTNKLQQENIILSARLEEIQSCQSSNNKFSKEETFSMKQYISQLEKELKEQERLLHGYQQENERLYSELKSIQKQKKLNEGKHKTHIEKLNSELIGLKEQLYLRQRASNFKLEEEMIKDKDSKNEEVENTASMNIKIRETDETLQQTLINQEEISKLKEENKILNQKLKEYTKGIPLNIIKKDLIKKDQEIHKLTEKIKILEKEKITEKRVYLHSQNKDHKKMKELENKLIDLEKIIDIQQERLKEKDYINNETQTSDGINYLEQEVLKLQQEMETKDQLSKQNLQELEQQYRDIKLGYEKRMKTIESQYQNQIIILKKKLTKWEESIVQGIDSNIIQVFPKISQSCQCSILDMKKWDYIIAENRDLIMKLEKLKIEIEELKIEYKKAKKTAAHTIASTQYETQEMISNMRSEMEELKMEHEKSEIRGRTLIINAQKEAQELAKQLKSVRIKQCQQAWLENMSPIHIYPENHPKIADLTNKLETKEIIITQLKLKLEEYEQEKDKIKIMEMRNSNLEDKIKELTIALNHALNSQSPQQKEICAMKEEIKLLDRRHKNREEEIQKLLYRLKQQDSKYLKKEIEKWQQRVINKNKEIEYFREELDVILRFLEELKQQGIVVPRAKSAIL